MTSPKHCGLPFVLIGLLSLVAAGGCGTNSDSVGALGHGDSGTRTGGSAAGAQGQGGGGPGGAPGSGGASEVGGFAAGGGPGVGGVANTGGATLDAGISGSGGKSSPDASIDKLISADGSTLETLCLSTGGKVESLSCCANQSDFPDSCLGGACGCAPAYSHTTTVCTCPTGSCFSQATGCGSRGTGGDGGTGGSGGAIDAGKADAPECVLTGAYCPWGYVLDDKGCQVCAPAPSGTGGAGGGDVGGSDVPINSDASGLSALCTSTGGHVNGSFCCSSVGDFPNSCLGGACGCSPTSSRTILTCTCPTGSCFTPASGCIPSTGPGPDAATTSDANGCTARPEGDGLCGGTRPPHYYACIMTMLPDPCVIQNLGDMTNGFCCP